MDRVDFLDFTLLTRDISQLDRYSTRQISQGRNIPRLRSIPFDSSAKNRARYGWARAGSTWGAR